MNYIERLALEIESRKSQLKTLRERKADYACSEIEREIEQLKHELNRYRHYDAVKVHHIYAKKDQ